MPSPEGFISVGEVIEYILYDKRFIPAYHSIRVHEYSGNDRHSVVCIAFAKSPHYRKCVLHFDNEGKFRDSIDTRRSINKFFDYTERL